MLSQVYDEVEKELFSYHWVLGEPAASPVRDEDEEDDDNDPK